MTVGVMISRRRFHVSGTVQGVGFRPFVYRLATSMSLSGFVENTPAGVIIEVEGAEGDLAAFERRLDGDRPALVSVLSVASDVIDPVGGSAFEIRASSVSGARAAFVLPDVATCDACLADVCDSSNRRYRYPFTNCTHCGPRFSIIASLPYDRANTSMKKFAMCPDCRAEYDDPGDRRFHAQPNACPACGPQLALWDADGAVVCERDDALMAAVDAIRAGRIVGLKGLGGFQLLVDAANGDAVAELRRRKHREEKPFAIMVASLDTADRLCDVGDVERALLASPASPIVLLERHDRVTHDVADAVSPRNPYLGVMLPYTPLHHLLMRELGGAVVATSGNLSDEPICVDEREAVTRLRGIADAFLVHDRPIVRAMDDSVVRVVCGREMVVRRARGYAPMPVLLEDDGATVLCVGAHQKNTVALAKGRQVFVGQHIGDLVTEQAVAAFDGSVGDLPRLYDADVDVVACDLHPDYLSTRRAEAMDAELIRVQHHHAHVASCMGEHGLTGRVLGVSWDGTGYGEDGTVWGGEFLLCDRGEFERVAHWRTFGLPGGDAASHEPRRSAIGLLHALMGDAVWDCDDLPTVKAFAETELHVVRQALERGLNCPVTSSVGRLFDAVASLVGLRQRVAHEGHAAMELEFAAMRGRTDDAYPVSAGGGDPAVIDWAGLIEGIMADVRRGRAVEETARKFHNTLVEAILMVAACYNQEKVVLSGGCFQNRLLLESAIDRLKEAGFEPYWHQQVPTNDGGVSLGQAVVARARLKERA